MSKPFSRMRALPDRIVGGALQNHRDLLEGLLRLAKRTQRAQKITSWWLLLLTLAVLWLAVWG